MDIRDLRFFCMTAELEHISKAAERLCVTQPYLTRVIGQIEAEFGTTLFDRVGRTIVLNPYGRVLYQQSKKVLSDMENLYTEMDFALERGTRTITFLCNTETYTSDMIIEFQRLNANYGLKILNATREEMVEKLKTGEADFALCDPPIDAGAPSYIATQVVLQDIAYVMLPPGHRLLGRSAVRLEELDGERLITAAPGGAIRSHVDEAYEHLGLKKNIVCETSNINLIIDAVSSGLGYAFVSHVSVNRHPEITPQCVSLDYEGKYGRFGLSYNRLLSENRNIKDFRAFAEGYFKTLQKKIDSGVI